MKTIVLIRKKWFLFILFFLFAIKVFGQHHSFEFEHYTSNDGLSFGYSNCIFQDSKGFIWIGTGRGLNRFDGLSFKTYLFDSKDTTTISGNVIYTIMEDSLKNIWITTNNNINLYNRYNDSFSKKTFRVNDTLFNSLTLTGSIIDSKGYLWVSTFGAIFRFKIYNNPQVFSGIIDVQRYILDEKDLLYAHKTEVSSFVEDYDHKIWVASFSNKLFYFDEKIKSFISMEINHSEAKNFSNKEKKMIKDKDGDFIITIDFNGLLVWDRKENKFNFFSSYGKGTGPNDNLFSGITQADNGLIWIGARSNGLNLFNKKTGKFSYYVSDPSNPYSLATNSLVCFYEDRSGTMWIGTGAGKGLDKYSPYREKFHRYYYNANNPEGLKSNNILCFAESKSGYIWIGTDGQGLNKLNRKTGKFQHYVNNPFNRNSISSNTIISLFEDHEGTLWIGTYNGGLGKMKKNQFSAYFPEPDNPYSLSSQHIWYVFEDSKENLWAATLNVGLDLFDRKTGRFYNYSSLANNPNSLTNNALLQIFEDSKQNLYFTSYDGVNIINLNDYDFTKMPPKLKFQRLSHIENNNSLSSNVVYCVAEDKNGIIWFGTQSTGIDKLDPKTGKFTNYSTNEGLPGNSVSSILVDNDNMLWLATDKGLAKFNPTINDIYVFDNQDGLQNKSLKGWALKTRNGEMFFGGPDGFNSFYPDSIYYNKNIPPVVITGLKLFNQPVKIGEIINNRILLENDVSETVELIFRYDENFFTFEFVALDYTVPEKNKYAYMMEGFNKNWIECGTKNEANYTNLDPGSYTFRVKACNNDGVWNEEGTSLKIVILPPWWQTLWFRIFAFMLIISSLMGYYLFKVDSLKKQKVYLQKLVIDRTKEIDEKNKILTRQANELNETNTLLEEKNQFIEEQNELLLEQTQKLNETNTSLEERQQLIRKQAEEIQTAADDLFQKNFVLSTLNATKDRFFAIIAHDLKNPFNVILGFSELLSLKYDKYDEAKKRNIINSIYESSKNLYKLLENLLQWARSQTNSLEFNPEEFFIYELVDTNVVLVENMLVEKNIKLNKTDNKNIKIYADRNMISTVVRNLLTNAIKFNENGTISIEYEQNNTIVTVKIKDTGIGISPEKLENLFNVAASKSTQGTRGETGTGLGLILCKEFIEKNKGTVGAESEVGKGSTFYFNLPASVN